MCVALDEERVVINPFLAVIESEPFSLSALLDVLITSFLTPQLPCVPPSDDLREPLLKFHLPFTVSTATAVPRESGAYHLVALEGRYHCNGEGY